MRAMSGHSRLCEARQKPEQTDTLPSFAAFYFSILHELCVFFTVPVFQLVFAFFRYNINSLYRDWTLLLDAACLLASLRSFGRLRFRDDCG